MSDKNLISITTTGRCHVSLDPDEVIEVRRNTHGRAVVIMNKGDSYVLDMSPAEAQALIDVVKGME